MAEQVDYQSKTAYSSGSNHGNLLRANAQRYYSMTRSEHLRGPKQQTGRVLLEYGSGRGRGEVGNNNDIMKENGIPGFRKRSGNSRSYDNIQADVLGRERQLRGTGGDADKGDGMSINIVPGEKKLFKGEEHSRNERSRLLLNKTIIDDDKTDGNTSRRKDFYSYQALGSQERYLARQGGQNIANHETTGSFDPANAKLSAEGKAPKTRTAFDVSKSSWNESRDRPRTEEGRVILSRANSTERRKVQVKIKQADVDALSPTIDEKFADLKQEGSRYQVRADSTEKRLHDTCYKGVNKIEIPNLNRENKHTEVKKNERYSKCRLTIPDSEAAKVRSSRSGIYDGGRKGYSRHSFQMGDEKAAGNSRVSDGSLAEKESQPLEYVHERQSSDPTTNFTVSERKLANISPDLMRSKEELINRSKECGRMLEEYRQREEVRREQLARGERKTIHENRSGLRSKSAEYSRQQRSSESESVSCSFEKDVDIRGPIEHRAKQDRHVEEDYGRQSPRYGKRKGSYIDSWLQSQQNRISTLVSAIKEEDSDESGTTNQENASNGRLRTKSMPPDSVAFLSWGRNDDNSQEAKPTRDFVHTRSHSGEEIMGIAKPKDSRASGKVVDVVQRETARSRSTSPRNGSSGYNPEDIRARSLYLQQETYSRTRPRDDRVKSPQGVQSPNASREFENNGIQGGISSPRSQSEKASPRFQRSFDSGKSFSVGSSPRLRKETTFDSDITTKVIPTKKSSPISPRPIVSRCSSSASDYVSSEQQQQQKKQTILEDQQQQQHFVSPRNALSTKPSSSDCVSSQPRRSSQERIVSPSNTLSRRSSSHGEYVSKQYQTSTSSLPVERSLVQSDVISKDHCPPQTQHPFNTPDRSGNEEFDWPAPPELDSLDEDSHNQSWPSSNSSPFVNRRSHLDTSRNFPVAVVKPLQHEKTQSWDGTFQSNDAFHAKFDGRPQNKQAKAIVDARTRSEAVTCYNVKRDDDYSREISRNLPRDRSSNSSQEIFNEKSVDVEFGDGRSCESLSNANQGISNLITQDFQWYKYNTDKSASNNASLERDATRESMRDSTQERLGRFKRGSKLLSSKYQSFSKSLENLSKVGKDLIKGKKKVDEEKKGGKEGGKESKKNRPERKSMVVGDLELNDEFAMKMERRSRLSLEMAQGDDVSKSELSFETRQDATGKRLGGMKEKGKEKREMAIDFPAVPVADERNRRYDAETKKHGYQSGSVQMLDQRGGMEEAVGFRNTRGLNDVVKRRYVKSAYFGDDSEANRASQRPKSELYKHEDIDNYDYDSRKSVTFEDHSIIKATSNENYDSRKNATNQYYDNRKNSANKDYDSPKNSKNEHYDCRKNAANGDYDSRKNATSEDYDDRNSTAFEDYDEPNDEEEKEMVKIVRKISGLRSSQMKPKSSEKQQRPAKEKSVATNVSHTTSSHVQLPSDSIAADVEQKSWDANSGEPNLEFKINKDEVNFHDQLQTTSGERESKKKNGVTSRSDPDPMKRISTSLSRVMTDLKELREQDLTLATQLITLGKSIKHFKKQKKEMDDFYAIIDEGESTDDSDSSDDDDEEEDYERTGSYSSCRISTGF